MCDFLENVPVTMPRKPGEVRWRQGSQQGDLCRAIADRNIQNHLLLTHGNCVPVRLRVPLLCISHRPDC
jgi:hypothetical protein